MEPNSKKLLATYDLVALNRGKDEDSEESDLINYLTEDLFNGIDVNVENVLKSSPSLLEYYEEPLYHVTVSLDSAYSNIFRLAYKWCSGPCHSHYDRWLEYDFKNESEESLTLSHWLTVDRFSLGSLIGLNMLVSHFNWTRNETPTNMSNGIWNFKVALEHDKKCMYVHFNASLDKYSVESYCLMVPYSSIHRILIVLHDQKATDATVNLVLSQPATLHRVTCSSAEEELFYERIAGFCGGRKQELSDAIGLCTSMAISFRNQGILWSALKSLIQFCPQQNAVFSPLTIVNAPSKENKLNFDDDLPCFACLYAYRCVASYSFEAEDQIQVWNMQETVRDIIKYGADLNHLALEKALFEIQLAMDRGKIVIFERALQKLFNSYCHIQREEKCGSIQSQVLPSEMTLVRKIVITPTHTIFLPPQPHLRTRMLRYFEEDYALKVSVRDDDLNKLKGFRGSNNPMSKEILPVFAVIKRKLLKGICIGHRKYTVLGCSTSQLRSNGFWYYAQADSAGRGPKDIRRAVGNFDNIKTVPKYLARLGMTLSQSQVSIVVEQNLTNLDQPEIDKMSDDGSYTFSDGIGKISPDLAAKLCQKLRNPCPAPCAFQIRYAGCKGMVVLDNPNKPTIPDGKQIIFRESMQKFESDSNTLEVLKISEPRPVFLNRPLITILEQMGVGKDVFLKLQMKSLQRLSYALIYDEYAVPLLRRYCRMSMPFQRLSECGLQITSEPFFRSLLFAITTKIIDELKTKARIPIPLHQGRFMFGVLDETGTLEYGEVFVQYTNILEDGTVEKKILKDKTIIVTRNPCMHPGDVRKLRARDVPDLHHIYDCIVFPAKGPRPHPDEMSGGDLDGDEFVVIWMDSLVFPKPHYEPMHFPKMTAPTEPTTSFEDKDLIKFFCNYMQNDYVGIMGHSHLVFADQEADGIFSKVCIEIARKYSINLDFVKSGYFERPSSDEWVKRYPDFMGKQESKSTYVSRKVLGDLYRRCALLEVGMVTGREYTTEESNERAAQLLYPGWEDFVDEAQDAYEMYKGMVSSLLKMYDVEDEGALISGAFVKNQKYLMERNEDSDSRDILQVQMKNVFDKMKAIFEEGLPSCDVATPFEEIEEHMFKKASAWYAVSQRQQEQKKFKGLPWAVADVFSRMLQRRTNKVPRSENALIAKIDEHILHTLSTSSLPSKEDKINKAIDILFDWANRQRHLLESSKTGFQNLRNHLSRVFLDSVDPLDDDECAGDTPKKRKLVLEDDDGAYSPGYTLIDCLQNLAMVYFSRPPKPRENMEYELGLLAVFTLHRIAATGSLSFLGMGDAVRRISQDVIPSIKSTDRLRVQANKDLCVMAAKYPIKVANAIKKRTGVDEIIVQVRNLQSRQASRAPYLHIFARGNCWVLQRLKSSVVQYHFANDILRMLQGDAPGSRRR